MKNNKVINIHKFKGSGSSIKELDWQLHLMVSVPILFIVVFSIIPMFGIRLAFVDKYVYSAGIWHSEWGGWKWFEYMFKMPEFWAAFKNTLIIACSKLVFGLPVPIIVSLLLNEMQSVTMKKTVQTLIYLP